jgi:amino acid transporter
MGKRKVLPSTSPESAAAVKQQAVLTTEQQGVKTRSGLRLPLWVAVAVSLATVGPTLAMAGNGQGMIGTVGKSAPLVFVIGLVGVALVAYGFVRLTRRLNHAGSVYALVGVTVGPRAGFFAGFAMLGTYTGFATGLAGLVADFTNAFLAQLQNNRPGAFQIPTLIIALVAIAIAVVLAGRDTRQIAKALMVIEGVGIVGMLILAAVIFAKGGAKSTGIDLGVFGLGKGVGFSGVLAGVVTAFLSWAGFEACAALGEETDNPRRNIPRALAGTLGLTGVLFVIVMFAQTAGFGTDAAGLKAFSSSSNTLGDLGKQYIGSAFGLIMVFSALISAFACLLASASSAGRILFAFARDGFGPRPLTKLDGPAWAPRNAIWTVLSFVTIVNVISAATRWPNLGSGILSLDAYVLFATAGAVALMLAYFMAEVAAIVFVLAPRFRAVREGTGGRTTGVLLPAAGLLVIAVVLWYNVKGQENPFSSPAYVGLAWAALGLILAFVARRSVAAMRTSLAAELGIGSQLPAAESTSDNASPAAPMTRPGESETL